MGLAQLNAPADSYRRRGVFHHILPVGYDGGDDGAVAIRGLPVPPAHHVAVVGDADLGHAGFRGGAGHVGHGLVSVLGYIRVQVIIGKKHLSRPQNQNGHVGSQPSTPSAYFKVTVRPDSAG